MARLSVVATVLALFGGVAVAGDGLEPAETDVAPAPAAAEPAPAAPASTETTATVDSAGVAEMAAGDGSYTQAKAEGGLFMGGFINNYYHQFYDPDMEPAQVVELGRVAPAMGIRFALFPSQFVGIELEGSVAGAKVKATGDGVQIYGAAAQLLLQKPGRITPFLALGASFLHSESETLGSDNIDVMPHAGAGARIWLSHNVALRLDGRLLRGPSYPNGADRSVSLNASYGEFTVGLSFGMKKAKTVVAVVEKPVDDDPDKDGVKGMADECPREPGNGTPNGCPRKDTDGDGMNDDKDMCPKEAETVNKFQDEDGCPDSIPDTDGDGMDDMTDKCKDQPEDKDTFQDDDGCPDPDNDDDGVMDGKDKCPMEKGVVENAGCPDADGDGDGVVDRLDNCPEEKGDAKNQGCKAKQLVVITKDQLKILDQVKFVTGSAKLSPASNKLLDNIARVLLNHNEIGKIKIEGHTDNVGKPDKNLKLSQDRADSVMAYLLKKGIAPERLEAIGHGDTVPLEDNKTAKGKAANRRVEFNIVSE